MKRLYFPADATDIRIEGPSTFETRTGRKVYGIAVHNRYQLAAAQAKRGNKEFEIPSAGRSARKSSASPSRRPTGN